MFICCVKIKILTFARLLLTGLLLIPEGLPFNGLKGNFMGRSIWALKQWPEVEDAFWT